MNNKQAKKIRRKVKELSGDRPIVEYDQTVYPKHIYLWDKPILDSDGKHVVSNGIPQYKRYNFDVVTKFLKNGCQRKLYCILKRIYKSSPWNKRVDIFS